AYWRSLVGRSVPARLTKDESGRRPIEPSRELECGIFFFVGAGFGGVVFGVARGGNAPTMAIDSSAKPASLIGIERRAAELVGYSAPTKSTVVWNAVGNAAG